MDTKWKMPKEDGKIVPSDADLHQMYVYLDIYGDKKSDNKAQKVALVYPGHNIDDVEGKFNNTNAKCDMIFLPGKKYDDTVQENGQKEFVSWQNKMVDHIKTWLG